MKKAPSSHVKYTGISSKIFTALIHLRIHFCNTIADVSFLKIGWKKLHSLYVDVTHQIHENANSYIGFNFIIT
jgi:hypothetical protein